MQQNYKAIAEIIKENKSKATNYGEVDFYEGYNSGLKELALKLADYFEKEDKGEINIYTAKLGVRCKVFNKKQFLNDCGVEE